MEIPTAGSTLYPRRAHAVLPGFPSA